MNHIAFRSGLAFCAVVLSHSVSVSFAQDAGATFPPSEWRAPRVAVENWRSYHHRRAAEARGASYPGLTIRRAPISPPDDIYDDGETRYNDIASFNPAPAITSGTQFPYGLDGIGGYGADLGFAEGQDATVYERQR